MAKLLFVCGVLHSLSAMANSEDKANANVSITLLAKIEQAQQKLMTVEKAIVKQRQQLANEIFAKQQSLSSLKEKAAVAQRLADENTLGLTQLQTRLDSWQQQSQYQLNLLNRFFRQHNINEMGELTTNLANVSTENHAALSSHQLSQLESFILKQKQALYPSWQASDIVMNNGLIQAGQRLTIGPVSWFASAESAGLLALDSSSQGQANQAKKAPVEQISTVFTDNASQTLLAFAKQAEQPTQSTQATQAASANNNSEKINSAITANITFDPTLNRVIANQNQQESALEHVNKGGIWAFPIIAFAVFALIIALLKSVQLLRLPKILPASLPASMFGLGVLGSTTKPFVAKAQFKTQENPSDIEKKHQFKQASMQGQLLQIAQQFPVGSVRDEQIFNQLIQHKYQLDKWLGAIAITAAVSPLLGLLGTVSGMIETFNMMTIFGSGDPEVVSGGIAQALITTELGLVVAIPALILNALLSRKVKSYFSQLEAFAVQLSQFEQSSTLKAA